jgi:hypothetical protein
MKKKDFGNFDESIREALPHVLVGPVDGNLHKDQNRDAYKEQVPMDILCQRTPRELPADQERPFDEET